jgi:hypothetical protein
MRRWPKTATMATATVAPAAPSAESRARRRAAALSTPRASHDRPNATPPAARRGHGHLAYSSSTRKPPKIVRRPFVAVHRGARGAGARSDSASPRSPAPKNAGKSANRRRAAPRPARYRQARPPNRHDAGPVDGAREVHDAARKAKEKRLPSTSGSGSAHARDGENEGRKRDPGHGRMSVAREAERQQDARDES